MHNAQTATQTALNLHALNYFLTKNITPAQLADVLDELIFDFNYCYGLDEDCTIPQTRFTNHIFHLSTLRNLFLYTALSNNEALEFERIKNLFD